MILLHDGGFKLDILNECEQCVRQDYRRDAKSEDEHDEHVIGVLSIHCVHGQLPGIWDGRGTWAFI